MSFSQIVETQQYLCHPVVNMRFLAEMSRELSGSYNHSQLCKTDVLLCAENQAAVTPDQLKFARDVFLYATSSKLGGLGKSGKAGDSKQIAAKEVCFNCIGYWYFDVPMRIVISYHPMCRVLTPVH